MGDHAAGLTYYALLSLFPGLLFLVSILGLFGGQGLIIDATEYVRSAGAPDTTVKAVENSIQSAISQKGTAVGAFAMGLATALWGASGAFGAVGRALNVVWRVQEGRGFVSKKLYDLASTLLVLAIMLVTLVLVFTGGGLAEDLAGLVGLGDTAAAIWQIARWPAALATGLLLYAVIYWAAPNVKVTEFEWITPGAIFGVTTWLVASGLFFLYASNFSSYGATYGAFAGAVILLVWLWLSNVVLLLGAEINAVIRLRRTPELPEGYDGPPLPERVQADD